MTKPMTKLRIIAIYGLISAVIVIIGMQAAMHLATDGDATGMALGYLNMLVALSLVFVGIKRYRDEAQGGVIRFGTALLVGAGIAAVACIGYVLGWEAYLAATGYDFMDRFSERYLAGLARNGATAAEIEAARDSMQGYVEAYRNPLARMGMTLMEIAPVAIIVTLVSAALLRNPRLLPARR